MMTDDDDDDDDDDDAGGASVGTEGRFIPKEVIDGSLRGEGERMVD